MSIASEEERLQRRRELGRERARRWCANHPELQQARCKPWRDEHKPVPLDFGDFLFRMDNEKRIRKLERWAIRSKGSSTRQGDNAD